MRFMIEATEKYQRYFDGIVKAVEVWAPNSIKVSVILEFKSGRYTKIDFINSEITDGEEE